MKYKQDEIVIQSMPGTLDNVNFVVNYNKNNMKHFHEISGLIKEMIYEKATSKAVELPNKNGSITYIFTVNKNQQKDMGVSQVRVVLGKDAVNNLELVEDGKTMQEVMESYSDTVVRMNNNKKFEKLGRAVRNVVLAGSITGAAIVGISYATPTEQSVAFDGYAPEVQQDIRNKDYVRPYYESLSDEIKEKISFEDFYMEFGYDTLNGSLDMDEVQSYVSSMGHSK